jgi:hypothetical protein
MPPDPQQTQNQPEPQSPDPSPEDREKAFWDKLTSTIDSRFDAAVERHRKPGTSRSGGRTTISSLVADLFFGPPKD